MIFPIRFQLSYGSGVDPSNRLLPVSPKKAKNYVSSEENKTLSSYWVMKHMDFLPKYFSTQTGSSK
jgi:hypothetical protein